MTPEQHYLINIIRALLHHATATSQPEPANFVDYEKVFRTAKANSVANMAAFSVCKDEKVPADIRKQFEVQKMMIVVQQMRCNAVISELRNILETAKIKGTLLKGSVIKEFYPDPFMRSMSDIDIFAEEADMDEICRLLQEAGFQPGVIGSGNHYEFKKYEIAKIEFHPELVAVDSAYGRNIFTNKFPAVKTVAEAMDLWNHTEPYRESEYLRQLQPEYHYVYIIMHMLNHFSGSGTGMRSIVDVWIMNAHYKENWDRNLVEQLLQQFGMATFEQYAVALADKWFDLKLPAEEKKEIDQDLLTAFESYILSSGTYGTTERTIMARMDQPGKSYSGKMILLKSFFLPVKKMTGMYPILKKAPVLLPVMWICRAFDVLLHRRKAAVYKMNLLLNPDEQKLDDRRALFSGLGLKK